MDRYRRPDKVVWRVGYGAVQLAGDGVSAPPRDRDEAIPVLHAAVDAGVDHGDTTQYYGRGAGPRSRDQTKWTCERYQPSTRFRWPLHGA
ncbi:aryl-alcohol dehydrogenase-like predicted oxidoreductase [Mycobacterium sp. AZCC_0083]|nr:aryl-alcohol dehydrogenase-like predicted oxidoreductase [Mycobacterium sp. AZCC_0083]